MGDTNVIGDMKSFFRNNDPYHPDGDAILPELVKLTLAQHRMILSLRDVTKEAGLQLRITNARLDLVEEELNLARSSLAEQPAPSLFSGVRTRSSSFAGLGRDTTALDYVPKFDLTDIGATLAAGPGPWGDLDCNRHHVRDGSTSPRPSKSRRRSPRPERDEHVKRTRISYDGLGGQDPKMTPSTSIFSTPVPNCTTIMTDDTSDSGLSGLGSPTESSLDTMTDDTVTNDTMTEDTMTETDVVPQTSLLRKLCGMMARLLLGL